MTTFAPEIVRRLTLARYQIARARLQLVNPTEFSAWQAATALHDAADIVVLAIADYVGVTRKKRRYLHEFPVEIEKKVPTTPFFDRPLIEEDLSEVRNPAKHRGGFPGISDVTALADRTQICLDRNCSNYLGQPLSAFSLADMIADQTIRDLVKEAERHIEAAKFTEAQVALKHAWSVVIDRLTARAPGAELPRFPLSAHRVPREAQEFVRDLDDWWRSIQSKLQLLLLGIDPVRQAAFEAIGPTFSLTEGGKRIVNRSLEDAVIHTAESANFSLLFVVDTVIRLQDMENVRQPHMRYVIRIKNACPYYEAGGGPQSIGQLPEGKLIEDAHVGGGHWADGSSAWFWEDEATGKTYLTRLSDAEPQRWISRTEYVRQQREKLWSRHLNNALRKRGHKLGRRGEPGAALKAAAKRALPPVLPKRALQLQGQAGAAEPHCLSGRAADVQGGCRGRGRHGPIYSHEPVAIPQNALGAYGAYRA